MIRDDDNKPSHEAIRRKYAFENTVLWLKQLYGDNLGAPDDLTEEELNDYIEELSRLD